ncbi:MAG: inositol monophosphatase [Puniceicoccaceae bacterium]
MNETHERLRQLLCELSLHIRDVVLEARDASDSGALSTIAEETKADTIYAIDKVSEEAIGEWFSENWPEDLPVLVLVEGIDDDQPMAFPEGTAPDTAQWFCLMDPIDGTRNIMYDKRSAWILAGIAPYRQRQPMLSEVVAAAMTELPTSRQWACDQLSATLGCTKSGITAVRHDLRAGRSEPLPFGPSGAHDLKHGFACISKFFPEGKAALAGIEEKLFDELFKLGSSNSPLVFDDQYICTGGQLYELIIGHDRMIADIRGYLLPRLGYEGALCCHPYDIVALLIAREAGCLIEDPLGHPLDGPMDTTSAINWVGYANSTLAGEIRPVLTRLIREAIDELR